MVQVLHLLYNIVSEVTCPVRCGVKIISLCFAQLQPLQCLPYHILAVLLNLSQQVVSQASEVLQLNTKNSH